MSGLSPYLRHRLVLEREVVDAALAHHAPSSAQKFVEEVFWRTYFKGYLERRPTIWQAYRQRVAEIAETPGLARDLRAAQAGATGIDAFDHWIGELCDTGYLHNHARMWFASIWIFTLRLPWEAGADLFLRHLRDGDAASNTLSWRWVAGLHTKGRTYLARPNNIARYTDGRFAPTGLATRAEPVTEPVAHPLRPAPALAQAPAGPVLWLTTEDECFSEGLAERLDVRAALVTHALETRSRHPLGKVARAFTEGACADASNRLAAPAPAPLNAEAILEAAGRAGVAVVAHPYVPVGPAADALAEARPALEAQGLTLVPVLREADRLAWQRCDRGYFALKRDISKLLAA